VCGSALLLFPKLRYREGRTNRFSNVDVMRRFQTPGAEVSAHYVVRSRDGQITQCVDDTNIAWHAGTWHMNRTSLGIEHEGYFHDPVWFTPEMYRSSARLVAYLCAWYGIPIDNEHIIGHHQVIYTECPGPWWWDYYVELVWRYAWG
jgi:N-acetyl-anhydromuramyl-L-alanine amidase AmpD